MGRASNEEIVSILFIHDVAKDLFNTNNFIDYSTSLTDYEDPNGTLHKSHLESWYDINVWSLIIDHGLRNLIGIETARYNLVMIISYIFEFLLTFS
jgi:hypothetical protein